MSQFYRFDEDEDKTPALREEKPNNAPSTPTDKPTEKKKKKIQVWYALGALLGAMLTHYDMHEFGEPKSENMHDIAAKMSVHDGCLYIGVLVVILALLIQNRDDAPWFMQLFGAALLMWLVQMTVIFLAY